MRPNFSDFKKEILARPEVKEAYDLLEGEFAHLEIKLIHPEHRESTEKKKINRTNNCNH